MAEQPDSVCDTDAFMPHDVATKWMQYAYEEAQNALKLGEVPVGAVFVKHPRNDAGEIDTSRGEIIARGHNLTNQTRNVRANAYRVVLTNLLDTYLLTIYTGRTGNEAC